LQVSDIHESGIVLIDSYIRDEFLEVTKRDFIHVGQQTIFPISIVLVFPISLNLRNDLVLENVRMTK